MGRLESGAAWPGWDDNAGFPELCEKERDRPLPLMNRTNGVDRDSMPDPPARNLAQE
ncbi:MAG: hypothetical protein ACR2MY_08980 [Candidatus Dormibacteria bacterium]